MCFTCDLHFMNASHFGSRTFIWMFNFGFTHPPTPKYIYIFIVHLTLWRTQNSFLTGGFHFIDSLSRSWESSLCTHNTPETGEEGTWLSVIQDFLFVVSQAVVSSFSWNPSFLANNFRPLAVRAQIHRMISHPIVRRSSAVPAAVVPTTTFPASSR